MRLFILLGSCALICVMKCANLRGITQSQQLCVCVTAYHNHHLYSALGLSNSALLIASSLFEPYWTRNTAFTNVRHDKVSPSSPGLAAIAAANAHTNANNAAAAAGALEEIKVKHPQRNLAFAQYWGRWLPFEVRSSSFVSIR